MKRDLLLDLAQPATIDVIYSTSHKAGLITQQECRHSSHFQRIREALLYLLGVFTFPNFWVFWHHGSVNGTYHTGVSSLKYLLGIEHLPGPMQFSLMCGFSFAAVLTRPMTACLLATYGTMVGQPIWPATLAADT